MKKFLLHACCAPCSIAIIDELKDAFDLTVFFFNPNIFPLAEYERRKAEVVKVCREWNVPMADMDYGNGMWRDNVARGMENEPEGGARCAKCFAFRLNKAAWYAAANNFDLFGTSLTSGRNKKAVVINPIGQNAGNRFGVAFYEADWKKDGRQEKAKRLVEERGIYRQNYCGCRFSISQP